MENPKQPINPCVLKQVDNKNFRLATDGDEKKYLLHCYGLTKREYAAIMAMQGMLANAVLQDTVEHRCKLSIKMADELLKQLEKQ